LIRNDANQVLEFLAADPKTHDLLINSLQHESISNIVGQLLVSEDRTKEYKYEDFKRSTLVRVIKMLVKKKSDEAFY
jgi:hypothetical protein